MSTHLSAMRVHEDELPLRDGTRTAVEVWTPDDDRRHPAILVRTPYGKQFAAPTPMTDPRQAVARGYAVVLQDVRGRGASEGRFEPFVHEQADGRDSVAWVARQPWCDGDVLMAGGSYVGAAQWLAAAGSPPGLRAIVPMLSADEYGDGWSYRAGVAELGFLASWCAAELAPPEQRMMDDPARSWQDLGATRAIAPWLGEWLGQPPDAAYWRARSVAHRRAAIGVPALVVGGWYDIFLSASLRSFARSGDPRDRLIVGPWGHDAWLSHLVGVANVGAAGSGVGRLFGWVLDFYDAVLADRAPDLPRVRAYALGARRWVDLPSWPPPGAQTWEVALAAGAFAVDAARPVPTRGGRGLQVHVPGYGYGVADQRPLLERADVHEAARVVVPSDTLLAGPIVARLAIAVDDDGRHDRLWTAVLCVEQPDGALHNLADGVASAPADADRVALELGDTFAWVPRGATLVLLVAGSSFPRWPAPAAHGVQRVASGATLALTTAPASLVAA